MKDHDRVSVAERALDGLVPSGCKLLTIRQTAAALGVSERSVWRWLEEAESGIRTDGFPRPVRIGEKVVRVRAVDLNGYLAVLAGQPKKN